MSGNGERFTGHGSEWRDSNLSAHDARVATNWVEQKIDKRSMLTNKDRVEDVRDIMWQLEKDGQIVVHRVEDQHEPIETTTLYGWTKKIPTTQLWHHKSLRPVRQNPGLSGIAALDDERDGHQVSGRDRPDVLHGLELSRVPASAISRVSPPCSCATSTRPM